MLHFRRWTHLTALGALVGLSGCAGYTYIPGISDMNDPYGQIVRAPGYLTLNPFCVIFCDNVVTGTGGSISESGQITNSPSVSTTKTDTTSRTGP